MLWYGQTRRTPGYMTTLPDTSILNLNPSRAVASPEGTYLPLTVTEPSLLLLIPAYNEEHRIEPVLRDYARLFSAISTAGNFSWWWC